MRAKQPAWRLSLNRRSAILLVGLLAGCARFESRPLSPAQTSARLEARRLDDAELKRFLETHLGIELETWPQKSWDLKMLTLAAFYFNPSLEVARAQSRVSQAGVRTAGARPNPTLNLVPGYDFTAANGLSPWIPFFSVDVPVETAGKRGHRIARAQHLSESARLNIAGVAWQVRSRVRASLLDYLAADRRATLLEQQLGAQEQIVKLLEQRLAVGSISRPELIVARIGLNKTQLELGDARSKRVEGRARLAEALGVSSRAMEDVTPSMAFAQSPADEWTSTEARRVALTGRSDVLGALAEYAAAEAALRLQIAGQYPDIHFSPGYQFDQGDNKWTLGFALELPVLNQHQGPIAEATARREEAGARFTEMQAKVIGEIDRAVAAFHAAREQLATTEELLAAAQQQQQSVDAQLKAGASDRLDLLSARFELSVATLAHLEGQAGVQRAIGALEDALQRPVDSIERTNSTSALINATSYAPERSAK